jgi:hypothetical protein
MDATSAVATGSTVASLPRQSRNGTFVELPESFSSLLPLRVALRPSNIITLGRNSDGVQGILEIIPG